MPKFKRIHQVTIEEYLAAQDDLFPDGVPAPAPARPAHTMPWRVRGSLPPLFPGAVDGVGSEPGASPAPDVVYSSRRRRLLS